MLKIALCSFLHLAVFECSFTAHTNLQLMNIPTAVYRKYILRNLYIFIIIIIVIIWSAAFMIMGLLKHHSIYIYTSCFIRPSGISDLCGTVASKFTPKGSMSTEGQTLQVSVLFYRCSICPPLVSVLVVAQTSLEVPEELINYPVYINTHKYLYIYFLMFILCFIPYFVQLYRVLLFINFHSMCCFHYRPFGCWLKTLINKN
jgi:hypothetical protein